MKNHKINHVHLGLMIPSSRGVGSAVSPANKHSFSVIQHMPATNVSSVPTLPSVDVTVLWVFFSSYLKSWVVVLHLEQGQVYHTLQDHVPHAYKHARDHNPLK